MEGPTESREERIRRLALLCTLDRTDLRLRLRASRSPTTPAPDYAALERVLGVAQHVPGAIGRWSRRIALGAKLLRVLR